jgi:hypothetical protein
MPSQLHEALLLLFRNRPTLAPELLRDALHVELPEYTEARIESADLTDVQPAEYRADLVVLLYDGKPVLGIVVEAQLAPDEHKRFAWPVYAVGLRARMRCPVCLLVVTPHESVARWANKPIDLGGGNLFAPLVLGPSGVPKVTDQARAVADPELAVLSAMAHGQDQDPDKALQIAVAAMTASLGLDAERSTLYFDLVVASLSEAARKSLQAMDPAKYEYQSEFAKRFIAQGKAEGKADGEAKGKAEGEIRGRAAVLVKQLPLKFGPLSAATTERVQHASADELDRWAERILSAASLDDVLG